MRSIYVVAVVAIMLLLSVPLQAQAPAEEAAAPPPAAGEPREPEAFTRPPEPLQEEEPDEPPGHDPTVTFGKNPVSIKMGDFTLTPFLEAPLPGRGARERVRRRSATSEQTFTSFLAVCDWVSTGSGSS